MSQEDQIDEEDIFCAICSARASGRNFNVLTVKNKTSILFFLFSTFDRRFFSARLAKRFSVGTEIAQKFVDFFFSSRKEKQFSFRRIFFVDSPVDVRSQKKRVAIVRRVESKSVSGSE